MSDDLVNALRDHAAVTNVTGGYPVDRPTLTGQAADRITALEARVKEMAMQSLADAGQAQDALSRATAAEAKLAEANSVIDRLSRDLGKEIKSRIEKQDRARSAEAKLAKAVEAMEGLDNLTARDAARVVATLAEIKGDG